MSLPKWECPLCDEEIESDTQPSCEDCGEPMEFVPDEIEGLE